MKKMVFAPLIFLLLNSAHAAVELLPVHLFIDAKSRATTLEFVNNEEKESMLDIRVFAWKSEDKDGKDTLEKTDEIITSRPVVTVPPHKKVTIRIIAVARTDAPEDCYRVVVKDITPLPHDRDVNIGMRLTSILPLFVINDANGKEKLELKDGVIYNVGSRQARITGYVKDGKKIPVLRYVLPGQSMPLPVADLGAVTVDDSLY